MLPSVKPETIEQYALRTFDAWKLGRKGVDDGVLIVVAKDDRRMRIEVGYGLEDVLTDLTAGRIINEQMQPMFRKDDYGGGLTAAVQQVIRLIDGGSLPPVKEEVFENQFPDSWVMIISGVLILLCIGLRCWLPAWLCSLISGLGAGGLVWWNTIPVMALFAGLFSAAMVFVLPSAVLGGGQHHPQEASEEVQAGVRAEAEAPEAEAPQAAGEASTLKSDIGAMLFHYLLIKMGLC